MLWTPNFGITTVGLVQSPTIPSSLWNQLAESKEFREEFSAQQLKRGVAIQVRSLLKKRQWTQEQLARNAGLTQGVVSRAQNPGYGNLTVNTINRIAAGFDVAFIGKFVPYGELIEWFENLSEDSGEVKPFGEEYQELRKRKTPTARVRRRSLRKRMKRTMVMRTKRISISIGSRSRESEGHPQQLWLFSSPNTPAGVIPFRPNPQAVDSRDFRDLKTAMGGTK